MKRLCATVSPRIAKVLSSEISFTQGRDPVFICFQKFMCKGESHHVFEPLKKTSAKLRRLRTYRAPTLVYEVAHLIPISAARVCIAFPRNNVACFSLEQIEASTIFAFQRRIR